MAPAEESRSRNCYQWLLQVRLCPLFNLSNIGIHFIKKSSVLTILCFIFDSGDWLLKFLYRTASVQYSIAGLAPVQWKDRRMHNIDLSDVVSCFLYALRLKSNICLNRLIILLSDLQNIFIYMYMVTMGISG